MNTIGKQSKQKYGVCPKTKSQPQFKRFKFPIHKAPTQRKCYKIHEQCNCCKFNCCLGVKRSILAFDLCSKLFQDSCLCHKFNHCNTIDNDIPSNSSGSGFAQFRINVSEDFPTSLVQFYVSYCKLSSKVISVVLKGPVDRCVHEAPIALTLGLISAAVNNNLENYALGAAYVTCQQTRDLLLGKYYIVVRTEKYPDCAGEIRGKLTCFDKPAYGYNCIGKRIKNQCKVERCKQRKRKAKIEKFINKLKDRFAAHLKQPQRQYASASTTPLSRNWNEEIPPPTPVPQSKSNIPSSNIERNTSNPVGAPLIIPLFLFPIRETPGMLINQSVQDKYLS